MDNSVVSFSFSWCSTGGPGAQLSAGFLYHILSPTHLISNSWLHVFTELYNSSIAHSIPILMGSQAGICHFRCLRTGMFDHHQANITVMQFRGHSLPVHQSMSAPWDFTLSPIVSQARLRDLFSKLPLECVTSFRCITLEWHIWPGRRSIYNNIPELCIKIAILFIDNAYDS